MRRIDLIEIIRLLSESGIFIPTQAESPEVQPGVVPLQLSDYRIEKTQAEVPRLIHTQAPRAEMQVSTRKQNNSVRLPQIRGPDHNPRGDTKVSPLFYLPEQNHYFVLGFFFFRIPTPIRTS